jgi:drug/metabolite transporter (DMT)-like permease
MVAAWSLNFVIGKIGLRYLAPLSLASFRVVFAAFVMLPIYLLYGRGSATSAGRQEVRPRSGGGLPLAETPWRKELRLFALLGVLGVAGNQVCFTVGLNYTTVGHS